MTAELKDFYEQVSRVFIEKEKWTKKYKIENWRLAYVKRAFEALDLKRGDAFLDIGVGFSGYTVIEAGMRGIRSIGIDISSQAARNARRNAKHVFPPRFDFVDFCVCSASNLPFRADVFSKVCSIAVLEHVPDDEQAVSEISRVLQAQGKAFISVPNCYSRILPIFILHQKVVDREAGHLRRYKAEVLADIFQRKGIKLLNVSYHSHLTKLLQYFLQLIFPQMRNPKSRIWWKLEEKDARLHDIATGTKMSLTLIKSGNRHLDERPSS
jgi:ubiquinone/menaquinone biosynthesis C-methylase UbiE